MDNNSNNNAKNNSTESKSSKITQRSITVFMTCLVLVVSAIIIIARMNGSSTENYEKNNQQTTQIVTIEVDKVGIDDKKMEEIWENSKLEGNKKEESYYRFEIPIYRGESEDEVFSMSFRFYVAHENEENYLDRRIIFCGYYNVAELAKENKIEKSFSISSGEDEIVFDILNDEKKLNENGDSNSMMEFSTTDVKKLGKIVESKDVKATINLKDKKYEFELRKEERNKLKALIVNYLNIQKEIEKNQ